MNIIVAWINRKILRERDSRAAAERKLVTLVLK